MFIINTKTICVIFYVVTNYKGGEIMEGDLMTDHVHMSVEDQCIIIYGVPEGEMMFDRHAN